MLSRVSGLLLGSVLLSASAGAAEVDAVLDAHDRVQRAFDAIRTRYPAPIDEEAMGTRAIQAMLQGLDTHSVFLDRNAYRAFQQQVAGTYVGLGVEVAFEDDALTIRNSGEGTPADRAGLRVGDRIMTLDGVSVSGLTLEQALHLARGEVDTKLHLTVVRLGQEAPLDLTVTRTYVAQATVRERRLEHDVAYLRIERFQHSTPQLVLKALRGLADHGGSDIAGLILDLRDNPGGSVRAAVGVAAAFLPANVLVVSMEGPSVGADGRLFATPDGYARTAPTDDTTGLPRFAKDIPMAVLVDGGSASAAEIVAGALQDYGRAFLVGTPTYGKGSVQSIVPLGDGTALKLTVARYLTPGGHYIQSKGIDPDFPMESAFTDGRGDDRQLSEALRILGKSVALERQRDTSVMPASTAEGVRSAVVHPAKVSLPGK